MQPKLDMIGLVVQDMAASVAFYRLLGLEFPENQVGESHLETTMGEMRVALDTVAMAKEIDPNWQPPVGQSATLAFLCATPAEVEGVYARLTEAGYVGHKAPWDAFWGQRYAQVKDPDGHVVDLFATLD